MGKIIQMFDVFNIRFGATLVGPTGAGKTNVALLTMARQIRLQFGESGVLDRDFKVNVV